MKKILLATLIIGFVGITGCKKISDYSLNIINSNSTDNYTKIYELSDGRIIYSKFSDIEIVQENKDNIKLSEALKKKKLTIDDIISKMTLEDSFNDGGSTLYKYELGEDKFSNISFYIVKCNVISGSKDIIFGDSFNVIDQCFYLHQ